MPGPQLDLDSYVPFLLGAIGNRMARGASRAYLERFRIGINELRIIAHVRITPGTTANEICQASGLDKGAASRSVSRLEQMEHIRVAGRGGEARRRGLFLTESGAKLHDAVMSLALEREARLLAGLSSEELATLLGLLRRLNDNASGLTSDNSD